METITLEAHDDRWIATFVKEKALIRHTLKQWVHEIHHVGSTAVPDLLSKPIIDIAIESAYVPPSPQIIDLFATIGYTYQGEGGIAGRFWFTKGEPRRFNLHFCADNSAIVKNQLMFRDRLLQYEPFRREYEAIKRLNCKGQGIDSFDYAFAKSDFINKVLFQS